jgi:hypothetical protein
VEQSSGLMTESKNHYQESKEFFVGEVETHDRHYLNYFNCMRCYTPDKAPWIWFKTDFLLNNSKQKESAATHQRK